SSNSNTAMPASIAATKPHALGKPAPSATSAGPGQNPASPQPTPNTALPRTSLTVTDELTGICIGRPSSDFLRRFANRNAIEPTAIAPAITNARDGSQRPTMSRNPSTFAGSAMPDTIRPTPNRSPEIKAAIKPISASQQMSEHEHGHKTACHKCCRRDKRTDGPARDAADTMAARATARVTRADAYQKACYEYFAPSSLDIGRYRITQQTCQHRCPYKPCNKSETPSRIFLWRAQQAAEDTADAGDTPVEKSKHGGRGANHKTASQ